jgi:hypothetical protein
VRERMKSEKWGENVGEKRSENECVCEIESECEGERGGRVCECERESVWFSER